MNNPGEFSRRHTPALKALQWTNTYGDSDGDGLYEYTREDGFKNLGWKDSDTAVVDEDGTVLGPPVSMAEEQGFVYAAKFFFAETLWWMGERDLARQLFREARELKLRIHDAFWMDDANFYRERTSSPTGPILRMGCSYTLL